MRGELTAANPEGKIEARGLSFTSGLLRPSLNEYGN